MRRIVVGEKERISEWTAKRIGCEPWKYEFEAFGVEEDGELIAGVIIDSYVPGARCSVHCAGEKKRWATRTFLRVIYDYVFRQLGCNVAVNTVSSANTDSLRFTAHIGYTEVCRIPNGCVDGDLVIFAMPKANCRWIGATQ